MKKKIFYLIRKVDDLIFSFLGPVKTLFIIRNVFGLATQLPVIQALEKKYPGVKINLTLEFDGCFTIPETGEIKRIFEQYYISPQKAVWKKWHFIITTEISNLYLRRHHTKIVMSHGVGFGNLMQNEKTIDYTVKLAAADGIHLSFMISIASCEYAFNVMPKLKVMKDKAFFITGVPKTDLYFNIKKTVGKKFLQTLELPLENKCIVIFSHWTKHSLFKNNGLEFIKKLLNSKQGYNIIITGHEKLWFDPSSVEGPSAPSGLYDSFIALEKEFPNLRFMTMLEDFKPLLASADLFIVDNSSAFIECCIIDKSILFFQHPDFVFQNEQVGKLYRNAAFCFDRPENICDLCTKALEQPDLHKQQRHEVVDFFLDNQGTAAQYIADLLLEMGRVCGPSSIGWKRVKQLSSKFLYKDLD